jgi:hypothetical protein
MWGRRNILAAPSPADPGDSGFGRRAPATPQPF